MKHDCINDWERALEQLNVMTAYAVNEASAHPEKRDQLESWLATMKPRYLKGERSQELFDLIQTEWGKFAASSIQTESREEYEARCRSIGVEPACGCLFAQREPCSSHKGFTCECRCHRSVHRYSAS